VIDRLESFAPALRSLGGGLTISGGEPMVQLAFTRRILADESVKVFDFSEFGSPAPTRHPHRRPLST
jgi:hypothetical protein